MLDTFNLAFDAIWSENADVFDAEMSSPTIKAMLGLTSELKWQMSSNLLSLCLLYGIIMLFISIYNSYLCFKLHEAIMNFIRLQGHGDTPQA